jgi:DNA-binding transcriptional MerR regulator
VPQRRGPQRQQGLERRKRRIEHLLRLHPRHAGGAVPKPELFPMTGSPLTIVLADDHAAFLSLPSMPTAATVPLQADFRSRGARVDISEVARRSGIPASTLRFYEEKGLISSIGRRGLRRLFDSGVLERLALIAVGRSAGFSLDEIGLMVTSEGRPRIDRRMLAAKAEELDRTIQKLISMRDGLRHAVKCPHPSHLECPKFRSILQAVQTATLAAGRRRTARAQRQPARRKVTRARA